MNVWLLTKILLHKEKLSLLTDKTFVEIFMEVHLDCEVIAQILEECVKDPSLRKGLL